jgi:undecaprenyl-diphosphatase
MIAAAALVVFLVLGAGAKWSSPVLAIDHAVDDGLRHGSWNTDAGKRVFTNVSEVGSTAVVVWIGILAVTTVFLSGYHWLAVLLLLAAVGGGYLDSALKDVFHLARPPLDLPVVLKAKAGLAKPSWGFPSGHSLGSMVCYGLLAYLLVTFVLRQKVAQVLMIGFLGATILTIGFSRLYLHAHYLSQVLGGFSFGAFWLSLWIGVLETVRRWRYPCQTSTSAPGKVVAVDLPPQPPSASPGGWQLANR